MSLARAIVPISLALIMAAPVTVGAPMLYGTVHGQGTASVFSIFGSGAALEGGLYRWSMLCGGCEFRMTLTDGVFVLVQDGGERSLGPGVYEVRGFQGLLMHSQRAPHEYTVEMHGAADVERVG